VFLGSSFPPPEPSLSVLQPHYEWPQAFPEAWCSRQRLHSAVACLEKLALFARLLSCPMPWCRPLFLLKRPAMTVILTILLGVLLLLRTQRYSKVLLLLSGVVNNVNPSMPGIRRLSSFFSFCRWLFFALDRSRGPEPNPPVPPGRVSPSARQI